MTDFKVGDQVIIMPKGDRGYVKKIDQNATYPIVVYYTEHSNVYENSYTFEGFRYLGTTAENQIFYITKDVVASTQTPIINPYWSIVKVNSLFIHLSHTGLGECIYPTSSINNICYKNSSVILSTKYNNYDLGPIQFDEVVNLLFAQQQSNSI